VKAGRICAAIAGLIIAAMISALGGCSDGATNKDATATTPAPPGSFTVHMGGEMTGFAGAGSP